MTSEINYENLLHLMEEGLIRADERGKIVMANEAAAKIMGYSDATELLGVGMDKFYNNPAERKALVDTIRKHKFLKNYEFLLKRKDGSLVWILCSFRMVENQQNEFAGTEGIFRDVDDKIKDQQALKERVKELSAIYQVSKIMEDPNKPLKEILQEIVDLLPGSMQYPHLCSARLEYVKNKYFSGEFRNSELTIEKDIFIHGHNKGKLTIAYAIDKNNSPGYAFLEEENKLIEAISERIGKIIERKLTEQALEVSEKRLKLALKGSNDAPWDWDLITNERFYSPSWWRQLGYKPRELPVDEDLFFKFIHEDDQVAFRKALKEAVEKSKGNFESEFRIRHKKGHQISVLARAIISYDERGNPIRVTGTNMDLTNRNKSLRDSEEKLREAERIARLGNYEIDLESGEALWSEETFRIFGLRQGRDREPTVEEYYNFIHPEDRELLKQHLARSIASKSKFDLRYRIITTGKKTRYVHSIGVIKLNKQGNESMFGTLQDITERVQIENELIELNATKDKLFSVIGHDLKTPINNIISLSALAKKKEKTLTKEKLLEFNDLIRQTSESAVNLLDNLLTWSQSQSQSIQIKPENLNIHSLVEECFAFHEQYASRKEINLKNLTDKDSAVMADREMITTTLRNLVSNALKYTEPGGHVNITNKKVKDKTKISVMDNGIGMSEDQVKELFTVRKNTSNPGTSGEKGTGLGLIICNDFIMKNNGKLEVESTPGQGTTFHILLNQSV